MGELEDSAAGIQLAKDIALARARHDDPEALRLINGATHQHLAWAIGYMGGMVTAAFRHIAEGDELEAVRLLEVACSEEGDTFDTQARQIMLEADDD